MIGSAKFRGTFGAQFLMIEQSALFTDLLELIYDSILDI